MIDIEVLQNYVNHNHRIDPDTNLIIIGDEFAITGTKRKIKKIAQL